MTGLRWQPVKGAAPSVLATTPAGRYSATPNVYDESVAPWTGWFKAEGASLWRFIGYAKDKDEAKAICEQDAEPVAVNS